MSLRVISLFSGIGGLELGLERAGMVTVGQCEMDSFACAVLEKHWPGIPRWNDVRSVTGESVRERCGAVDVVCGGFPCQDISSAGKGVGLSGERSGLWFEMLRVIREVEPLHVIAENVPALRSRGADVVLGGLEEAGYTAGAFVVGADDVGAPHRRKRVFIVARRVDDAQLHGRSAAEVAGGPGSRGDAPAGALDAEQPARPSERDGGRRDVADAGQRGRRTQARADEHGQGADRVGGRGRELAHSIGAGRTSLGSRSVLDGERPACGDDADGCEREGADVGDAEREGREEPRRDDGATERTQGRGGVDDGPERSGGMVAHSIRPRLEGRPRIAGDDGQERAPAERDRDGLADSPQRRREAGAVIDSEASPLGGLDADGRGGDIPRWPPGPADRDAWAAVLEREPGLAPAHEEAQPALRGMAPGLPTRLARRWRRHALKALGNAVVPQVAEVIGRAIMEAEGA